MCEKHKWLLQAIDLSKPPSSAAAGDVDPVDQSSLLRAITPLHHIYPHRRLRQLRCDSRECSDVFHDAAAESPVTLAPSSSTASSPAMTFKARCEPTVARKHSAAKHNPCQALP